MSDPSASNEYSNYVKYARCTGVFAIYYLSVDRSDNLFIKAIKNSDLSEYQITITPDFIKNYRLIYDIHMLYGIILDEMTNNKNNNRHNNHNKALCSLEIEYDKQKDIIEMKLLLKFKQIEESIIWVLEKITNNSTNNSTNNNNTKVSEKVEELEEKIRSIKREFEIFKMETAGCNFLIHLISEDDNGRLNRNICIDERDISDIFIANHNNSFEININGNGPGLPYNFTRQDVSDEDILKMRYLEFLNRIRIYDKGITAIGIDPLDVIVDGCKNIRTLIIRDCKTEIDISKIINFPKLYKLKITKSPNVCKLNTLQNCESLKILAIDSISQTEYFGNNVKFAVNHI